MGCRHDFRHGRQYFTDPPHLTVFPRLAILTVFFLEVFAFALFVSALSTDFTTTFFIDFLLDLAEVALAAAAFDAEDPVNLRSPLVSDVSPESGLTAGDFLLALAP